MADPTIISADSRMTGPLDLIGEAAEKMYGLLV